METKDDKGKQPRRARLSDLLGDARGDFARQWEETAAAPEFGVVPAGRYLLEAVHANLEINRNKTPAYHVRFRVVDPGGEFDGRLLFHRYYLTAAALPMTKRDLAALGITALAQLEQPLPQGLRVQADVVVKQLNDGREYNEVHHFKAAPPADPDPFAPTPTPGATPGQPAQSGTTATTETAGTEADDDRQEPADFTTTETESKESELEEIESEEIESEEIPATEIPTTEVSTTEIATETTAEPTPARSRRKRRPPRADAPSLYPEGQTPAEQSQGDQQP